MNRVIYFNRITARLAILRTSIEMRGALNVLDYHIHSENFYAQLLNVVYGWSLANANAGQRNAPSIDLFSPSDKLFIQVSATATTAKITTSLSRSIPQYAGFRYKFVSIAKPAEALRDKTYANPHRIPFTPADDIIDIDSILAAIQPLPVEHMKQVCDLIERELKPDLDPLRTESNIAHIIQVLSKVDWTTPPGTFDVRPYAIEDKIRHNGLTTSSSIIHDFKVHYPRIAKLYAEFDKSGSNKSLSILNRLRNAYVATEGRGTPDQRFRHIIDAVCTTVRESANRAPIPEEELELCVQILVVDAFVRCKIFENPAAQAC